MSEFSLLCFYWGYGLQGAHSLDKRLMEKAHSAGAMFAIHAGWPTPAELSV